jgi:hypothetical protein
LKTTINDDAKLLLEITRKQPLALSKFLFSGRRQSTHKRHSTQISGWLLYVCMPPVDFRRPSGTIDATEDQLGAWPTFMGCL